MNTHPWLGILCVSLCAAAANAQTLIDGFEYASDDELVAAWMPSGNAIATVSSEHAPKALGTNSMRVEFNFPSSAWATETVRGADLPNMISIGGSQFVTYRLRGDTNFVSADFKGLYLYAYDDNNNFGRWGPADPTNPDWQIVNFTASTMEQPWDSTTPPDLSRIVKFAWFQYGSEAAIDPYTATIYIDDLQVRDTALTEFPPAAAPRTVIDDFETYADGAAILKSYSYVNNGAATTTTTVGIETPAPQGSKALKMSIDFSSGQWPWGCIMSGKVAPFSFPTNGVLSVRFKGDAALASVVDGGTTFWISLYDKAGKKIDFINGGTPVVTSEWTTFQGGLGAVGDTSTIDIGNLVQWRILVQGWTGTTDSLAMSATFYVDDIRITVPSGSAPSLAVARDSAGLTFTMSSLTAGASYDLQTSSDLSHWTAATTVTATGTTATWSTKPDQPAAFFRLLQK